VLKKLLGLAVVVCLTAALAACGHSQAAANPGDDGPEETAVTTTSATASGTKKKPTATTTKKSTTTTAEEETTAETTKKPTAAAATTTAAKKETVATTVVTVGLTTTTTTEPTTTTTTGYVPRPKNPAVLSDAQEQKIKEDFWAKQVAEDPSIIDYANYTIDDLYIKKYYGTYNGYAVVMVFCDRWNCNQGGVKTEIAGVEINLSIFGNWPFVYVGSDFIFIREAYNEGILTKQDIQDIAYYSK